MIGGVRRKERGRKKIKKIKKAVTERNKIVKMKIESGEKYDIGMDRDVLKK